MDPRFQFLLVEDDPGHALLLRRSLERAGVRQPVVVFEDGESLLEHLDREPGGPDRPRLLLLDLRLPKMGGIDVLAELGRRGHLEPLPVVVLTTSALDEERRLCESLGCAAFLTKPVAYRELRVLLHRLGLISLAEVPDPERETEDSWDPGRGA